VARGGSQKKCLSRSNLFCGNTTYGIRTFTILPIAVVVVVVEFSAEHYFTQAIYHTPRSTDIVCYFWRYRTYLVILLRNNNIIIRTVETTQQQLTAAAANIGISGLLDKDGGVVSRTIRTANAANDRLMTRRRPPAPSTIHTAPPVDVRDSCDVVGRRPSVIVSARCS